MIETNINISVYRKSDIDLIKQTIISCEIEFPIYIFGYENHYQINLTSDYEEWGLNSAILKSFPGYEFTSELQRGRKEIRLQISRYQSELSTDDWGRPIENPLNEVKYLVKQSDSKPEEFSPKVNVLFGAQEQSYYINIADGINKANQEKGFLLQNEFRALSTTNKIDFLKDRLYKTPHDAFQFGYYKMQETVNEDFNKYIENQKKEIRQQQKNPRKIVRDFIKSCNKSEYEGILKNLNENVVFIRMKNRETICVVEGIKEFEDYIKSADQDLCAKNFTIRPSWNIKLPVVTIRVKSLQVSTDDEMVYEQQYKQISFVVKEGQILRVIEDNKI